MGVDLMIYRESIGNFFHRATTVKKGKRLSLLDVTCITILAINGKNAVPFVVILHFFTVDSVFVTDDFISSPPFYPMACPAVNKNIHSEQ